MDFKTHVAKYFEAHSDLLKKIQAFEQKRGIALLKKLNRDKDKINLYSWLTEVKFGLWLDQYSYELKHDASIENKTPDWTAIINGQKVIAEVLRVNTPQEELEANINQHEQIRQYQDKNPGVWLILEGEAKMVPQVYVQRAANKLREKSIKYGPIASKSNTPFLICVETTFNTFIDESDCFDLLIAHNTKGLLYSDADFSSNVTGVLLLTYFKEFFYFHNELAENKLNQENYDLFSKLAYWEK